MALAACIGDDPVRPAGVDPADSGPLTAPADSSAPVDAGSTIADPDAALGFCARFGAEHDFCADFDTRTRVDDGWSIPEVTGASDTPAFASLATSPPRSMKSVVRHTPGGPLEGTPAISRLSYQKALATAGSQPKLAVAFELYVERADVDGRNIFFTGLEIPGRIALALSGTARDGGDVTCELLVIVGGGVVEALPNVPVKKWTRIALTLAPRSSPDGGAAGGGFTVGIDDFSRSFPYPEQPLPRDLRVDVGLGASNGFGGDWTAYFDNVLIDGAR